MEQTTKEAFWLTELGREFISNAALDPTIASIRVSLASFAAKQFQEVGEALHVIGYVAGSDRKNGFSPFGNGSDETVGVALILQIASQLTSSSAELLSGGRTYAGAALLRQIVEVEYLAWAFEYRDNDAEKWLRSDDHERQDFFRPAKLRKAAQGHFRGEDYGYHCDLGGHPTPKSLLLLGNKASASQLLLSDLLGHVGRIWDHVAGWAKQQGEDFVIKRDAEIQSEFGNWKQRDPLVRLPSPPQP